MWRTVLEVPEPDPASASVAQLDLGKLQPHARLDQESTGNQLINDQQFNNTVLDNQFQRFHQRQGLINEGCRAVLGTLVTPLLSACSTGVDCHRRDLPKIHAAC